MTSTSLHRQDRRAAHVFTQTMDSALSLTMTVLQNSNRVLANAVVTAETWAARRRQRRQLQALGHDALSDCGISGAEAHAESSKPFWRA
jgi:uncharacterized protein YjiS (DUF1127 family)